MDKKYANREFQKLATRVNKQLEDNDGLIGDQKDQVDLVKTLENKFMYYARKYQQTVDIYKKFIQIILKVNKNILTAKPYFREKSEIFNSGIARAIKSNDPESLVKFSVNYQLINFIVTNWNGKLPDKMNKYYSDFIEARRILIENNLPLAINRAKLFYRKTPKTHLTLLDFINICTQGLIVGIDKYEGEYTKVWRSVCIGRMVGYMIEEYSKTFLRMYPVDKKILYRANSLKYRLNLEEIDELTKAVNESFEKEKSEGKSVPKLPISEMHIRTLLNGSNYISTTTENEFEDGEDYDLYNYSEDYSTDVEEEVSNKDAMVKVVEMSKELDIVERKIIKLKGVSL